MYKLKEDIKDTFEVTDNDVEVSGADFAYLRGYTEYMEELRREAAKYNATITFDVELYPSRNTALWYSNEEEIETRIALIETSDNIIIEIRAYSEGEIVVSSEGGEEEDDIYITAPCVDVLEKYGVFEDNDFSSVFGDDNVFFDDMIDYFTFIVYKENKPDTILSGDELDEEEQGIYYDLDAVLDMDYLLNTIVPAFREYWEEEDGEEEESLDEHLNEEADDFEVLDNNVELITLEPSRILALYDKGSQEYMEKVRREAEAAGLTIEFDVPLYPLRRYAHWYGEGDLLAKIRTKDNFVIEITTCVFGSLFFSVGGEEVEIEDPSDSSRLEEYGIFNDNDLDDVDADYEDFTDFFEFDIHIDKDGVRTHEIDRYDLQEYGAVLEEPLYDLFEAFNIDYYTQWVIPTYLRYLETISDKPLTEDRASKERFVNKFGKHLSDRFYSVKSRLRAPESDISYWMTKSSEELESVLKRLETTPTRKQKDEEAKTGSKLLYSDADWSVYEILNLAASRKYGKNTMWCISGDNCETETLWKYYKTGYEDFPEKDSKFIFFISRMFEEKYAVLYNTKTKKHLIWNEIDNPVAFILDAPKVNSLPDFSKVPEKLKADILKSLNISSSQLISIVNSYEDVFPDGEGDSLEKYSVEYKNDNGDVIIDDLYRSPETDLFIPIKNGWPIFF